MSIIDSHAKIDEDFVIISQPCRECRNVYTLTVPRQAYTAFTYYCIPVGGAWPESNDNQRTMIKYEICTNCAAER
jgi:hypothetical protein